MTSAKQTITNRNNSLSVTGKPLTAALLCLLLLCSVTVSALKAADGTPMFDEACRLYENGKIDEALNLYLQLEKDTINWKLFYNIGNCYYKQNQLAQAKIYYLKARRLKPFETSIDRNISFVNKRLNDKIPETKEDFISRLQQRIESLVSLDMLSILLLLMFLVFNGFLFMLIRKGKRRMLVYGIAFSLAACLLMSGYHLYRVNKHQQRNIAVITAEDAQLRSGPGENNTILFKVNPGLKVRIIDTNSSGQWLQVSASPEIAGWIETTRLERI